MNTLLALPIMNVLGDKGQYTPLLVAIMVIFSTALFGFVLPKTFEYTRNKYRDELKDALAIEKSLKERNKKVCGQSDKDEDLDKIITHYRQRYVENRLEAIAKDQKKRKWEFEMLSIQVLLGILAAIIVIVVIAGFLMNPFLGFLSSL